VIYCGGVGVVTNNCSTGVLMLDLRGGFTFYSSSDPEVAKMQTVMHQDRLGSIQWEWLISAMVCMCV
jgi:hypothetical protein